MKSMREEAGSDMDAASYEEEGEADDMGYRSCGCR